MVYRNWARLADGKDLSVADSFENRGSICYGGQTVQWTNRTVDHPCWTIRGVDNPQVGKTTMNRKYYNFEFLQSFCKVLHKSGTVESLSLPITKNFFQIVL
jgi:hypothetical protein